MEIVFLIVVSLSIVQSIFGVGLLVFGTPTLLLIGYPLHECLFYLLPSSIAISILQLIFLRSIPGRIDEKFLIWCMPAVLVTLTIKLLLGNTISIEPIVASMLFVGCFSLQSEKIRNYLISFLKRFNSFYLFLMGVVHGVSNMGGSLLTIYASLISGDKRVYLKTVAQGYLIFGVLQLAVVSWMYDDLLSPSMFIGAVVSALTFIFSGQYIFKNVTPNSYQKLLSLIMFAYALLLSLKSIGLLPKV